MTRPIDDLRSHQPAALAVGGSAGSLEVIVDLLSVLPRTFAVPVVVVVHLPPDADGGVAALLATKSSLPVVEVEDKMPMARGAIYVAPADYHLLVERNGCLALSADLPVHFSRPSIDVLFESVALALGARAFAILLSGASADGAAGLAAVRKRGGITWVQSPATARMPLMPQQALALAPHPELAGPEMVRILEQWGYAGA